MFCCIAKNSHSNFKKLLKYSYLFQLGFIHILCEAGFYSYTSTKTTDCKTLHAEVDMSIKPSFIKLDIIEISKKKKNQKKPLKIPPVFLLIWGFGGNMGFFKNKKCYLFYIMGLLILMH